MLIRRKVFEAQRITDCKRRQGNVLGFYRVDFEEPVEFFHRTGRPEGVLFGVYVNGGCVKFCRSHLRRKKSSPNQFVEFRLTRSQKRLQVLRCSRRIRGPDCLVGFLGAFCFRFVRSGRGERIFLAEGAFDELFCGKERVAREIHRIGPHVGNQPHRAFPAEFHPLIQFLGSPHGLGRREAKAPPGILLEGACGKRREGVAGNFLSLNV